MIVFSGLQLCIHSKVFLIQQWLDSRKMSGFKHLIHPVLKWTFLHFSTPHSFHRMRRVTNSSQVNSGQGFTSCLSIVIHWISSILVLHSHFYGLHEGVHGPLVVFGLPRRHRRHAGPNYFFELGTAEEGRAAETGYSTHTPSSCWKAMDWTRFLCLLEHPPGANTSWSMAKPPLLALPSRMSLKSVEAATSTCPAVHSGRAVFSDEADIDQI